jgi:hypothetical protein
MKMDLRRAVPVHYSYSKREEAPSEKIPVLLKENFPKIYLALLFNLRNQ